MTIDEIVKKLNREYKDDKLISKASMTPTYERLATGAMGFDYPCFGGLPLGRICVFSGLQHSGKSTAAAMAVAAYQRKYPDRPCVYVDVEHSLDLKFQARMNGLDLSKLNYVSPTNLSGEQVCDMIVELEKADDVGMIVIDSLPALLPAVSMESDLTKDTGMRGTIAKPLYRFLALMAGMVSEKNNILVLVNQVRQAGTTFTGAPIYREPCGSAPGYYSSVSVRFGARRWTKGDDMDACKAGNGDGADGFRLSFKVLKNKTAPASRGGGFITYRYATGLDWLHDLLEVALAFGFIRRVNNITYELVDLGTGEVLKRGKRQELVDYIRTDMEFQKRYIDMLEKYIQDSEESYGDLLDERAAAEIDEQERQVRGGGAEEEDR